ncbi:MAG: SUMF1/EgtB/PvdO family nonheme iron enzyme [Deltaproteobacteria bacterium]|nr:SUMF1/EgtB/PvdO family nonheme iron enzyme [Deltaproteobacteria bacterium]MBT6435004.1 SUMF1/EgtB/PvdO family nonheme iron enzyme [Deltaproteobacteria bacterium]
MNGNVAEWVWDWYNSFLINNNGDVVNGCNQIARSSKIEGPLRGDDRVKRGGDENSFVRDARSASRSPHSPDGKYNALGFRVVRTLP